MRIHPRGLGHETGRLIAGDLDAGAVDVQDAFLTRLQQVNGVLQVADIAHGDDGRVVDHPQTAGSHFQVVCGHTEYRGCGSCRAGYRDTDLAGISRQIVVHPYRGVAGATVGIQTDVDILGVVFLFGVQKTMKRVRGDLVPEPHFIVDVAVQQDLSQ